MRQRQPLTPSGGVGTVGCGSKRSAIVSENGLVIHVHNDTPAAEAAAATVHPSVLGGFALAGILVALVVPMMTPGTVLMVGVPILIAGLRAIRSGSVPVTPLVAVLAVTACYLFANALWSVDPIEALGRAALFTALSALAIGVSHALETLDDEAREQLGRGVLIAIGVGALFLAVETALGQPIRRFVTSVLPFLRPSPKHARVTDGWVTDIGLYTLNRNLGLLIMLLWPTLLIVRARLGREAARVPVIALVIVTAVAVFHSEHETSMVALVAGSCVVLAMSLGTVMMRALRVMVAAGWVIAALFMVPIVDGLHKAGLHQASWLPRTARNRVVLWDVTAENIAKAPILGIGIGSTKPLDEEAATTAQRQDGNFYPQRTGRHAHNLYLQTWYELGAVGALLLLAIGLGVLRLLAQLPVVAQPLLFAGFVASAVMAAFTWGMWQPWFMAAFGMWAILMAIAIDAIRASEARRA